MFFYWNLMLCRSRFYFHSKKIIRFDHEYVNTNTFVFLSNITELNLYDSTLILGIQTNNVKRYNILMHDPIDMPIIANNYYKLNQNGLLTILLQPTMTNTSEDLRNASPNRYFNCIYLVSIWLITMSFADDSVILIQNVRSGILKNTRDRTASSSV